MTLSDAQQLGQLLAAARAEAGLSTPQLAKRAAISQSNIVRLEQGRIASPAPSLLQRLAEVLGLPLSALYALAGIPLPTLQPYLRSSYGLNEADARKAQAYVERLAASYGADGSGPYEGLDEQPD